jgi:hypothetical protein
VGGGFGVVGGGFGAVGGVFWCCGWRILVMWVADFSWICGFLFMTSRFRRRIQSISWI